MKIVGVIARILTVLAAIVGAVYALATYGEQIVAWAKKIMSYLPECKSCDEAAVEADEEVAEEAPAAEEIVEEVAEEVAEAVEEVVEAVEEFVADEADFEG